VRRRGAAQQGASRAVHLNPSRPAPERFHFRCPKRHSHDPRARKLPSAGPARFSVPAQIGERPLREHGRHRPKGCPPPLQRGFLVRQEQNRGLRLEADGSAPAPLSIWTPNRKSPRSPPQRASHPYHFDHSMGQFRYGANCIQLWGTARPKRIPESTSSRQRADPRRRPRSSERTHQRCPTAEAARQHAQSISARGNVFDLANKLLADLPHTPLDPAKLAHDLDPATFPSSGEHFPGPPAPT